jgi:hypothetical protein
MENPPNGKKSRIPYYEGSLPPKKIFYKLKLEKVTKMKNILLDQKENFFEK